MRWFWIDRYTEFVSGERATAVKNVSLSEEQIHDHFPGEPIMPNSLILEGLAQTGGLLLKEHGNFQERVVLAKVSKVIFHRKAAPGDTLIYKTTIEQVSKEGAMISATSHCNGELQAEAEIYFAHLDDRSEGKDNVRSKGALQHANASTSLLSHTIKEPVDQGLSVLERGLVERHHMKLGTRGSPSDSTCS